MRKIAFVLLLSASFFITAHRDASAFDHMEHRLGAGIELGTPNTLTGKYYLSHDTALQLGIGLPGFFRPGILMHLDFVYELRDVIDANIDEFSLFPYIGVGAKGALWQDCRYYAWLASECGASTRVGGRVPIGLGMHLADEPIELALQVAPGLGIRNRHWDVDDPSLRITLDVNLAFRYYF